MLMERIHPEDRDQVDTSIQHALREGSGFEGEYRILLPDGGMKRLRYIGRPVAPITGKPHAYVGTVIEVTPEDEAAQARVGAVLDEMRSQAAWMMLTLYRIEELNRQSGSGASQNLTPRELEVVKLVAEANTSKQVASRMGICVKTVESHRTNVMRKLQVHSVIELVRYAIRNGIVRL
jgi:DNA-binding CsgD family transcriptional regulator